MIHHPTIPLTTAQHCVTLRNMLHSWAAGYDRMQKLGFVAKEIRLVGGGSSNR